VTDFRRLKRPRPYKRKMTKRQEVVLEQHVENPQRFTHVIGLDEVGWGAIAGPIGVAAVVVPFHFENPGFKDSKRFSTDKSRLAGAVFARANVLAYEVVFATPEEVNEYGPASSLGYLQRTVVNKLLAQYPDSLVVVDGNKAVAGLRKSIQLALPKADSLVPAVSAASIIAKVARDTFMVTLGEQFPDWDFHKNKGYPTPEHGVKLNAMGPTVHHRMNIAMVREALEKKGWYEGQSTRND